MQHNWNVNRAMKRLKVFLWWRLDMTQNRCLNTVVQKKPFCTQVQSCTHLMECLQMLGCLCGPCSCLLPGNLTVQRRFWAQSREELLVLWSGECFLQGLPALAWSCAPLGRTDLVSAQWAPRLCADVLGILFLPGWGLILHSDSTRVTWKKTAPLCTSCSLPLSPPWGAENIKHHFFFFFVF